MRELSLRPQQSPPQIPTLAQLPRKPPQTPPIRTRTAMRELSLRPQQSPPQIPTLVPLPKKRQQPQPQIPSLVRQPKRPPQTLSPIPTPVPVLSLRVPPPSAQRNSMTPGSSRSMTGRCRPKGREAERSG